MPHRSSALTFKPRKEAALCAPVFAERITNKMATRKISPGSLGLSDDVASVALYPVLRLAEHLAAQTIEVKGGRTA